MKEVDRMEKKAVLLYPQFSEYELSVALSILMQGGKPIGYSRFECRTDQR
jgi:hypothetical protein